MITECVHRMTRVYDFHIKFVPIFWGSERNSTLPSMIDKSLINTQPIFFKTFVLDSRVKIKDTTKVSIDQHKEKKNVFQSSVCF